MAEPDGNNPQPESFEGCDGEAEVFIYPNSEVEDGDYTVSGEHTGEQNTTSFPYCGTYGGGIDDFSNASVTAQTTPRATIDLIDAVGKDNTAKIDIYVLPTNNSTPITLTLSPSTGTGQAIFTSNNSTTLTITNTTSVEIKGITESSTRDNLRLEAKANNRSLDTEDLTVLSVILSLRFDNNDDISSDNDAKNDHIAETGRSKLGGPFFVTGIGEKVWGHSIEIIGTVLPSNYLGKIILQREVIESPTYQGNKLISLLACDSNIPTPCIDTSLVKFRDDTVSSQGRVFDLDNPGFNLVNATRIGTIRRKRTNFRQWATVLQKDAGISKNVRVSADITWFQRLSVKYIGTPTIELSYDVTGDNEIGSGTTPITWNLMP